MATKRPKPKEPPTGTCMTCMQPYTLVLKDGLPIFYDYGTEKRHPCKKDEK